MIMFLFIMFLVCSSSIFDIVMIDNEFMYMFAKCLALYSRGLSGRLHVSMVLRCCLPANAPYWPGHMVVRGCDNLPIDRTSRTVVTLRFKDKTRYTLYVK
jgi:hypothetical protein